MKARRPQLRAGPARGSERARLVSVLGDGLRARARLQVPQLHARVAGAGRKRAAVWMARHAQHPRLVTCTGCTPRVFAAHSRVHACSPAIPRHATLSMLPAARGWHVAGARPRSQCVSDSPPHAAAPPEGHVTVFSCARRGPGGQRCRAAPAREQARAAAGRAGPAPEKASTSEACSMSYRLECMSSHAVSMNLESAPGAARQRRRAGGGLRHRAQGAMSGWAPRAWREGQVPHGVVVAAQRVQQLAGGHVEDGHRAVHRAARQPLPVRAVRHAQHKLLLFQLLLGLAAPPQPARWPGAQALSGRERGSSSLLMAGRTRAQRAPRAARAAP